MNGKRRRGAKKAYRICSKIRFSIFVCLMSAAVFLLGGFAFADTGVKGMEIPAYAVAEVHAGDTLWGIAGRYADDETTDIRAFIREIRDLNGIGEDCVIRPGLLLRIPTRTR